MSSYPESCCFSRFLSSIQIGVTAFVSQYHFHTNINHFKKSIAVMSVNLTANSIAELSLEQEWNRSPDESVVGLIEFTLIEKEK